jgi:hypothetical protein
MEQTDSPSVPGQRPISGRFNPEATEFSPTAAKAGLTSGEPTPPASPQQRIFKMPSVFDGKSFQACGDRPIWDLGCLRAGTLTDPEQMTRLSGLARICAPSIKAMMKRMVPDCLGLCQIRGRCLLRTYRRCCEVSRELPCCENEH